MDLALCYDALWYAGAALVAYLIIDIGVCKGFVRRDGKVKDYLEGFSMAFFMRGVWVVGRRTRIVWEDEVYYWRSVILAVIAMNAIKKLVGYTRRTEERAPVPPPPEPAREARRRGRGGRRG